jgi:hypothetical protein
MTCVTRPGTLVACTVLAAGAVSVAPAAADPPPDPVSGLVGRLLSHPSDGGQHRARDRGDHGYTHARDGVLRRGCHDHRYRYVLTVRTDDWALETFLDDRTGETIASGAFTADSDPKRGPGVFRFCRYGTHAGRFTIRAKLSYDNGAGERRVWLTPSHFRLRRP